MKTLLYVKDVHKFMNFWGETQRNLYENECTGPVDAIKSVPAFSFNKKTLNSFYVDICGNWRKNTVNFQRWNPSIYRDEPT